MQPEDNLNQKNDIIVGLDCGTRRTGVALAEPTSTLAFPCTVLETEPQATLAKRLQTAVGNRHLVLLVVGLPLDQYSSEGPAAQQARNLGQALAAQLGCPVTYIDERFSSRDTFARRREAGIKAKTIKRDLDAWAATSILQAYLEQQNQQNS